MTRREALSICEEALLKHEGGKEAYLDLVEDLLKLEDCDDECDEHDEEDE